MPRPGLAAILVLVLLSAATMAGAGETDWSNLPAGWRVAKAPHSYAELIKRLDQAVKDNKMGLVNRASATVGAKQALGKDIPGNMVVGVYRPDFAVRMLEASIPAGIEAPIRFYITENADGTATLSYRTPTAVFAPYTDGGEPLRELAAELDGIFEKIANQAAAP
ncbi:MAG: DUF302 domain-containing protein [Rhodospirillales bacterium]|nr:DUF302 domain-containing protein [Rhodospirillales bacterium]